MDSLKTFLACIFSTTYIEDYSLSTKTIPYSVTVERYTFPSALRTYLRQRTSDICQLHLLNAPVLSKFHNTEQRQHFLVTMITKKQLWCYFRGFSGAGLLLMFLKQYTPPARKLLWLCPISLQFFGADMIRSTKSKHLISYPWKFFAVTAKYMNLTSPRAPTTEFLLIAIDKLEKAFRRHNKNTKTVNLYYSHDQWLSRCPQLFVQ